MLTRLIYQVISMFQPLSMWGIYHHTRKNSEELDLRINHCQPRKDDELQYELVAVQDDNQPGFGPITHSKAKRLQTTIFMAFKER